jgi:hypothetical protein
MMTALTGHICLAIRNQGASYPDFGSEVSPYAQHRCRRSVAVHGAQGIL